MLTRFVGDYPFDIGNAMCGTLRASIDSTVSAGTPVAIDKIRLALEDEFYEWRSENDYLLSVGLSGDVSDLRLRLNAAFAKAFFLFQMRQVQYRTYERIV